MTFQPVACAVIGLGWMGRLHSAFLAGTPLAELRLCCDLDLAAATRSPAPARFVTAVDEALAEKGLEAVFVCTPPDTHREIVEKALAAGLHVFCEKPLATSVDDANAMIAAAGAGENLVVGHTRRFDPRFLEIRSAIDSGRVGRPLHLVGGMNCPRVDALRLGARVTLALECAVHDIDVMRWYAGEVTRVYAEGSSLLGSPYVENFVATLQFSSGAVGCLHHSWVLNDDAAMDWEFYFQVNGEGGLIDVDGRMRGVTVHAPGGLRYPDVYSWPALHGGIGGVLANEDGYFLRMVREGGTWPLSLEDGREAVSVAIDIDTSIAEGRPVNRKTVTSPARAV